MEHIFELFFTTKESGLAWPRCTGSSRATTVISLATANPVREPRSSSICRSSAEIRNDPESVIKTLAGGNEILLVVDDDENILDMAAETLRHFGCHAITCT